MASGECLKGEGLSLVRGQRLLFEGLEFSLAPGDALMITGRNGAGKSSLLRLVAGLLEPTEGTISNPFQTALLSSEPALKPDRTVASELAFWAGLDGTLDRLPAAASAMSVDALMEFRCGQLSSGQRQRVALTRTIASGTQLWLLDEPANALDATSEGLLMDAIARHRATGGLVMIATHAPLAAPGAKALSL